MKSVGILIFLVSVLGMTGAPAFHEGGIPIQNPQRFVEEKETPPDPAPGVGTREIPRADGEKDKIYYSVSTPEEEKKTEQEEKEKLEKSWDMLRNIIIDQRRQR